MKNAYLAKIKQDKVESTRAAMLDGIAFGLNVTSIALNRLYGFGDDRLTRLETEVNRLIQTEFIDRADPEQAAHDLRKSVEQIRHKKEWDKRK